MLFENIIVHSPLERTMYYFHLTDRMELILNQYSEEKRETTRHGYKRIKYYAMIMPRDSTIKRDQINIPDKVIEEVKTQIFHTITLSTR